MADENFLDRVFPESAPGVAAGHQDASLWDEAPYEHVLSNGRADDTSRRLALALAMAVRGLRVFPLLPGSKEPPRGVAGVTRATTDAATIRTWFADDPAMNYGIAAGAGLIIVDVDATKGGHEALKTLGLPETFAVKTPGGGLHLYLTGPDVAQSVDRIAPGVDIRSAGGYVVGPGSYFADPSGKKGYAGPYEIVSDLPAAAAPESLILRCGQPRERSDAPPAAEQDAPADLARARYWLANAPPAVEGQGGDAATYKVACELRDMGLTEPTALDLMREHWNARCSPPWDDAGLSAKVANAFTYGQNQPAVKSTEALAAGFCDAVTLDGPASAEAVWQGSDAPSPLIRRKIRAGEMRPPVAWRIKGVLPATGVGMIFGPPSAGKSTLVLDLAAHLSGGRDWFGRRTKGRAGTLILACEGAGSLGTRLDALAGNGTAPAIEAWDIGALSVSGLASLRSELAKADAECREHHGFGIGLVVLDTISASGLVDDENANAKVAAALKALADFAGSVGAFGLAVHHPRKDGETFRGAGAFEGNTDLIFEVKRDGGASTGVLSIHKARDGETGKLGGFRLAPVTLGQDEDGDAVTACVVEPRSMVIGGQEKPEDPDARLAEIIRGGPDGDGPNSADTPGGCFRMDEGRSRDSIYRAIAEAFGIPFGTGSGFLKLAAPDRAKVRAQLHRVNARLACSDDGRDRERRQVRVVLALHPPGAKPSDFSEAVTL